MKTLYAIFSLLVFTCLGFPQVKGNIYFLNKEIGWVNYNWFFTLRTTDGGETWSKQRFGRDSMFQKINFVNDNIGYAKTNVLHDFPGFLYMTNDKGENWKNLNHNLTDFYFFNEDTGYGIVKGNFCITTDGGISWDSVSDCPMNKLWVHNTNEITAMGNLATIKSINRGLTWDTSFTVGKPPSYDYWWFDELSFADDKIGYIGFRANEYPDKLYKTTDGGNTWDTVTYGKNISFKDSIGYMVGWTNPEYTEWGLLKTTNKGETWDYISSCNWESEIFFLDKFNGFLYVDKWSYGVLIFCKTSDGGLTWSCKNLNIDTSTTITLLQENNIPLKFLLHQNYPNPFNPSTKIKYTLPKNGFVTIKVYDVLGKEIVQLVNEEKPSGEYEVEFDGSTLSSGIYYYKIQAGEFVQTKKMVLMK